MGRYDDYYGYAPYVPVAERRAQAAKEVAKRMKSGEKVTPICIEGRIIATTFWGNAWCENLEGYSDFENRLPRGRTYVRNGSVVDLKIRKGRIEALVSGSSLYKIQIEIDALPKQDWRSLKVQCSGKIGTLVELLQGKLSKAVMEQVTNRHEGLFPKPKEIRMRCSCPDSAGMCKHIAAVMYGVGNRLDSSPELLFELRGVDHTELIEHAIPTAPVSARGNVPTISVDDLGSIFDIEIGDTPVVPAKADNTKPSAKKIQAAKKPEKAPAKPASKKTPAAKKPAAKKEEPEAAKTSPAKKSPVAKKSPAAKKASPAKKASVAKKAPAVKKPEPGVAKVEVKPVESPSEKPAVKKVAAKKPKAKPAAKKA